MTRPRIELKQGSAISVRNNDGKKEILACPNRIIRPMQVLVHTIMSITGLIGLLSTNVVLAVPMVLLLSPLNVIIAVDEFYRTTLKSRNGFNFGVGRNIYKSYEDLVFEILHPSLRYNLHYS